MRSLFPPFAGFALAAAACALALGAGLPARAQNAVGFSPETTADLGVGGGASVLDDEDVGEDDAAGSVLPVPVGAIPPNADVIGYEFMPNGDKLLSFDTTIALPGLPAGAPAEPRDVVLFDPVTLLFSLYFDGSANGVPANAQVDGVSLDTADDLMLSFDITVSLPGLGPVDDEDVVTLSGGVYSLTFDGSANGVAAGLDVDGVDLERRTGELLLSFDATGTLGGVPFDDEDVVAFDATGPSFAMYADSSLSDPVDWPPTDLVALPEPGFWVSMLSGLAALALLGRLRAKG